MITLTTAPLRGRFEIWNDSINGHLVIADTLDSLAFTCDGRSTLNGRLQTVLRGDVDVADYHEIYRAHVVRSTDGNGRGINYRIVAASSDGLSWDVTSRGDPRRILRFLGAAEVTRTDLHGISETVAIEALLEAM